MHDASVRRDDTEIAECGLPPTQQRVPLPVALEFQHALIPKASADSEPVHLHRVIDHQVGRHQRVGPAGVGARRGKRIAHGGQIHHRRHAGEIL